MKLIDVENDTELQRVLWACYEYWQTESLPVAQRSVCYSWVIEPYKKRFGGNFHQSRLAFLAKLGLLKQADTSRAGGRRYYTIANTDRVVQLLKKWKLK